MGNAILIILTILGGISLCVYGMTILSEGILKIAGVQIRASLRTLSQNRLSGFWLGQWVTMLLQSSSAVTMMVVGYVSTGLLTLSQSISVIIGANVGTTITAWIVAIFGFVFPIGYLAIPMVVFAFPFYFSSHIQRKSIGEILMGVTLMVLGFTLFIGYIPSPLEYPDFANAIQFISGANIASVLLFVLIGILLTILLQSSSATTIFAMVCCASGWISIPMAAGLVIGDNVGTTLTTLYASRDANVEARRAAGAHLLFNLVGMCLALILLYPILFLVEYLFGNELTPVSLAIFVASFHTGFNLLTSLLFMCFQTRFSHLLQKVIVVSNDDDEEFHLSFIQGGILSTAELSVEEARKETVSFGERCQRMLQMTVDFIHMSGTNAAQSHMFSRIEKNEKITDRLELEIVKYLNSVDKSSISEHMAQRVMSLFRVVDELESIGDSCYNLARTVVRSRDAGIVFIKMQKNNIDRMLELNQESMAQMVQLMQKRELSQADMYRIYNQEDNVNNLRNLFRDQNIGNIQSGYYSYQSGVLYMDIISGCEKLCDYIVNVLEDIAEQNTDPVDFDDDYNQNEESDDLD